MFYDSDLLLALGTSVLAVDPLFDALEAVDMCTVVEGCTCAGAYFFDANGTRFFLFLFAHARHRIPVLFHCST